MIETAAKLPFGVQVQTLKAIYDLTFPDEEFLGNLVRQLLEQLHKLPVPPVLEDVPEEKVSEVSTKLVM